MVPRTYCLATSGNFDGVKKEKKKAKSVDGLGRKEKVNLFY